MIRIATLASLLLLWGSCEVAMAQTAKLGNPMSFDTQVGPVTTPPQYDKILSYLDIAKGEGADCVMGGGPAGADMGGGKYFVQPTVFISRPKILHLKTTPKSL